MQETGVQSLDQNDPLEEGNGNPLQYSGLENLMDRGTWQATVHGCRKESDTTPEGLNNNVNRYSTQGKHRPSPFRPGPHPGSPPCREGPGYSPPSQAFPCDGSSGLRPGLHSAHRQDRRLSRSWKLSLRGCLSMPPSSCFPWDIKHPRPGRLGGVNKHSQAQGRLENLSFKLPTPA